MFSSGPNYPKLKTNLRLAVNRLKLLEKKKTELAQKARKEIADYISDGKCERAKIRVEHIIREDYMVEAMELIEMYCDILLSRFGLLQEIKGMDPSLAEAISSLLWVAPRLGNECEELKVISDQLTGKYGKKYAEACRVAGVDTISEKLRHKMSVQAPPKILVEKYLIEIAKIYNIAYEPDPHSIYPTPGFNPDFEPNMMSEPPPFAYNIPPSNATPAKKNDPPKTINSTEQPKPLPRSKMSPDMSIPDLPSVPSDTFPTDDQDDADECDFQDIVRRFDELNKKK
ncbi:unnamed protein product [Nesidiocoris tenuis]|uniref:IST1 homolog n=1 Tax=Nesidiocoris tenuis TaxID=355587 RepID=A0A6H5FXF0_9HEMI|nr:unnamed protein product [Nesidiocoris tenuis]CAA9994292.1 unnamed protein product [Nesidiocoris tenuis]